MGSYVFQRLIYAVFVLWGALTVIFLVVRILPGDPASMMLGAGATQAEVAQLQQNLGLDESMPHQYVTFMSEAARLAISAVFIALLISFPLGIIAALRQRSPVDYAVSIISLIGQSVPSFWLGIMLILIFARQLRWLPSAGSQTPKHLILPAITLALPLVGVLTR